MENAAVVGGGGKGAKEEENERENGSWWRHCDDDFQEGEREDKKSRTLMAKVVEWTKIPPS